MADATTGGIGCKNIMRGMVMVFTVRVVAIKVVGLKGIPVDGLLGIIVALVSMAAK